MVSLVNKIRIVAILAGFICMELEILGTRLLAPIFGPTIYVWTSLIGITLTFLAIGYWYGGKLADRGKININTLGLIVLLLGVYIALVPRISRLVFSFSVDLDIIFGPLITAFFILALPIFFLGFVVPTSVKLITQSLTEVGSRAGEIYSLATIGSIIGTFFTGFFLISYFGVVKTSLITGIALILVSLIIIRPQIKFLSLLIVPFLLIPLSYPSEILESFDSYYGLTRVMRHENHLRVFVGTIPQTAIDIETKENEIGYINYFEVPFIYNPGLKDVLMVGLAGGYTAKNLVEKYGLRMDVVEVEPKMLELAKEYFYWKDEAEVFFDDGRHFLRNAGKYDVIILDIGQVFPAWHLFTLEALREYKEHLNPEGILVFNIFSAREGEYSKLTQTLYKTLQEVFYDIIILGNPNSEKKENQSLVFLASKKEIDKEKISKNVLTFNADKGIKLTTDNHPLAEFYDYLNWSEWGGVSKNGLKYFLH